MPQRLPQKYLKLEDNNNIDWQFTNSTLSLQITCWMVMALFRKQIWKNFVGNLKPVNAMSARNFGDGGERHHLNHFCIRPCTRCLCKKNEKLSPPNRKHHQNKAKQSYNIFIGTAEVAESPLKCFWPGGWSGEMCHFLNPKHFRLKHALGSYTCQNWHVTDLGHHFSCSPQVCSQEHSKNSTCKMHFINKVSERSSLSDYTNDVPNLRKKIWEQKSR